MIRCTEACADGNVVFYVDTRETFDALVNISQLAEYGSEVDYWGGFAFDAAADDDESEDGCYGNAKYVTLADVTAALNAAGLSLQHETDGSGAVEFETVYYELVR